jgi:hypothetical protein
MTLRRYMSAAHAVATYLQLRTRLDGSAMDLAVQEIRAHGQARTEPEGLDDLIVLKRCLTAVREREGEAKWLIWESMQLNQMSSRAAAKAHNARAAAANERAKCISHTTAIQWRTQLDALFEQQLEREGVLLRNAVGVDRMGSV